MSYIKRTFVASSLIALAMLFIPVSVSPTGSIEVAGLCADGDCKRQAGAICWIGELPIGGWVNVAGK